MNGTGYAGLYNRNNQNNQSNDNLNVLRTLSQDVERHRAQDEKAQADMALIQDQIRKETDTLLLSDKIAIRNKARSQFNSIATQLQSYGGRLSTFMAQGGRALIEDYKQSVLGSREMAEYQENTQSMHKILELERTGKGHLINPIDRIALDRYRKQGSGKISYTGMLQDVEMPPSNEYDWNTDVPAINILKHKDNYLKLYGNYIKSFPNLGEPSEKDLIEYVRSQYSQRGSNTQRNQWEKQFNEGVRQFNVGQNNWEKDFDLKEEAQKFNQANIAMQWQMKMSEASGGNGSATGGGAVAGSYSEESQISNLNYVFSEFDNQNTSAADFFNPSFWNKKLSSMPNQGSELGLEKWSIKGYGGRFQNSGIVKGMTGTYSPLNAMKVTSIDAVSAAKAVLGVDSINGKSIKSLTLKGQNLYGADGVKLNQGQWLRDGIDKPRDFNIEGVASVGVIKDGKGNDMILMNKNNAFGSKTDHAQKTVQAAKGKNIKLSNVIVARDPVNDELIYIPFNTSSVPVQAAYQKYNPNDSLTHARKTSKNTYFKNQEIRESNKQQQSNNRVNISNFMEDKQAMNSIAKTAQMYGNVNDLSRLIFGFYSAISGLEGKPGNFNSWVNSGKINETLERPDVKNLINKGATDVQIIQYLSDTDTSENQMLYKNWLTNIQYLKQK